MRVGIASPHIAAGDAVGNDVLGMSAVLREQGAEVRLFAERSLIDSVTAGRPSDAQAFLTAPTDLFIYHHSVGWDQGLGSLREVRCRKVVKYHNVTPPAFFQGLAHDYVVACESGRAQLTELAEAEIDLYLADSQYNLSEMWQFGAEKSNGRVVPPFHHAEHLRAAAPDQELLQTLRDGSANLLTVGRVVPNKGHGILIEAFAAYFHSYNRRSRLLIVGKEDPRLEAYSSALRNLSQSLGVAERVLFLGGVGDAQLKAAYEAADIFVTTSLHEGFCVPLVEAMALRIPIAAIGFGAVPETVGSSGLVWREVDSVLLAAATNRIIRDPDLRLKLSEAGWRRYQQHFAQAQIRERFLSVLAEFSLLPPELVASEA